MFKLDQKIIKSICKFSETEFYKKNLCFFRNTKEIDIIYPSAYDTNHDLLWYSLIYNRQGNAIPFPIFANIAFEKCLNWDDKRDLKKLGKLFIMLEELAIDKYNREIMECEDDYLENITKTFDAQKLQAKINNTITDMYCDIDTYDYEEGQKTSIVEILVSSDNGIYIPKYVCEMFDIDKCKDSNDENYYLTFEDVEENLNYYINHIINIPENCNLYFRHSENGDYCLFITMYLDL